MAKFTNTFPALTIGLDLGDEWAHFCGLDASKNKVLEGRVAMTDKALRKQFPKSRPARIALEAGAQSAWVYRLLKALGHEVIVAQPRKLRLIYCNDKKCDRVDAQQLATFARMDPTVLHPIELRDLKTQADLATVQARHVLVATRTKHINHVRGVCKSFGVRLPSCSTESFHRKVEKLIPPSLQEALNPMLQMLGHLTESIAGYDNVMETHCKVKYREATGAMQQVAGIGPVVSLSFALKVGDRDRFKKSRLVGAWVGLRPRLDQSGETNRQLGITKAGDAALRRLLIQAAHYNLGPFGPDSDLRRWGLKIAERGGARAKKIAVVAVARKLAVLMHRLWITGEEYEPLRQAKRRAAREVAQA